MTRSISLPALAISRRSFLSYVGAGAAGLWLARAMPTLAQAQTQCAAEPWVDAIGRPSFQPVAYPLPLAGDGGSAATDAARLAEFAIHDDLVLPEGFRYQIVARWGDRFGPSLTPERQFTFGYNCDFTGMVPIADSPDEFFLLVNHEYISARPWLQGVESTLGKRMSGSDGSIGDMPLLGLSVNLRDEQAAAQLSPQIREDIGALCKAAMEDLGVSVLRVKRLPDRTLEVIVNSPDHFRIHGFGGINLPDKAMGPTGPAARFFETVRGTFSNCSGAVTPWGTFLTCEENFQDQVPEFIAPDGSPLPGDKKFFAGLGEKHPTNLPFELEGLGTGITPPMDGRQYGWVCEVDPGKRSLKKHTSLGRFRHENVALRAEAGKPLVAYMGDDRRGGHVWKFVSNKLVTDPADPNNTQLLEDGTLYAAKFDAAFTGQWLPLLPTTQLARPQPGHLASGHLWLPHRPTGGHIAVGTPSSKSTEISVKRWIKSIEAFANAPYDQLTLRSLVDHADDDAQGVLLMDAYVMANAIGATPTARPEDIEIHPVDHSVYVAFTDSTGSGDGSPDIRIFPDSAGVNSRQYGAIYRFIEDNDDPAATTFTWGKFVSSGEAHDKGGGFACADNLVFDREANLWMVCDISTVTHNHLVDRENDKTKPGEKNFVGIFGNNAMFCIPTRGAGAGVPVCFATGPMECEITGPTFSADGQSLLLAIQHPGEMNGTRDMPGVAQPTDVVRTMHLMTRGGEAFTQSRTVPIGSNFASPKPGDIYPRPSVVCVVRSERS